MTKIENEYETKVLKLIKYSEAYHVLDKPLVSDDEYDKLYREVVSLERTIGTAHENSPTLKVGGVVSDKFEKYEFVNRMWSQEDIFNEEELSNWLRRLKKDTELVLEPKYDGLSLKLIYNDRKLIRAVTRGDGFIGEDVTNNAKTIKSIPLVLPESAPDGKIEINGEVAIKFSDFEKINEKRSKAGLTLLANPRNAAAGAMRTLDSTEVANKCLIFCPWDLVEMENADIANRKPEDLWNRMKLVYNLGFIRPKAKFLCKRFESIDTIYKKFIEFRKTTDIGLDGMVIKVNDPDIRKELGYTNKFPKWSCAYKFPPIEKTTKILDIKLQVGRTGAITPVAKLEPVLIDGSTVRSVTLSNFMEIERKDIRLNDYVTLIKSGDIIPKITYIFKDRRTVDSVPITRPTVCPSCEHKLVVSNRSLKCVNINCGDKVVNNIVSFADRGHMNINGLGPSLVTKLYQSGLVKEPVDIYKLTHDKLSKLNLGELTISNLLESIEKSKGVNLSHLIGSIGIPEVGRTISKTIFNTIGSEMLNADYNTLKNIKGVGDAIAVNLRDYTHDESNRLTELVELSKAVTGTIEKPDREWRPNVKTVTMTGSSDKSKHYYKELFEKLGIDIASSVSKNVDLVVYGVGAGLKLDKAIKLGVDTITYEDLEKEIPCG